MEATIPTGQPFNVGGNLNLTGVAKVGFLTVQNASPWVLLQIVLLVMVLVLLDSRF